MHVDTIYSREHSAAFDQGWGEFDLELVDNPFHAQRFQHLKPSALASHFIDLEADNDHRYSTRWRDTLFLLVAVVIAIGVNHWLGRWVLTPEVKTPATKISIDLIPAGSKKPASVIDEVSTERK